MNAVLCFSALIVAALAPTTSHKQIRDADGRAWMLIRSKKVLVLHAPKAGQLQVLARSTSARTLRVRAAGEVIASEPLEPGQETVLPGQKTGAPALVRVPVPSGGEIFRVEVPRGRAWVAVSLLSPDGAVAFEQPEVATPGLVGLIAPPPKETTVPGLVGLAPPVKTDKSKTKPKSTMPGLVALGDAQARKKNALKLAKRSPRLAPLVKLTPDKAKEKEQQGPAVIDRPITGLPPVENQRELVINKPKTRPPAQPAEPAGPTLLERLSKMQLGMSVAGLAQGRADRFGGQVELEIDVPGTQRLFAAAFYVGYSPTQRTGVLRSGNGVALPVVVAQRTEEIPLGLTLRARPLRLSLGQKPLAVFAELQAGWHLRNGQTAVGMLRGSVQRDLSHTVDSSGITGGLGLGAELGLTEALILGAHARIEASQAQEIDVPNLIRTQVEQSGASLALSIRYRFGS